MKKSMWWILLTVGALLIMLSGYVCAKVADFFIKTGDTLPYYTFQVVDSDGTAVDISSATITAVVENLDDGSEIVSAGAVNITNGAAGYAELRLADGETNTAGSYAVEFKILLNSLQFTIPASFNAIIQIKDRY